MFRAARIRPAVAAAGFRSCTRPSLANGGASGCRSGYSYSTATNAIDRATLARVMNAVTSRRDVEYFMHLFGKDHSARHVAVVKVGGAIIEEELDVLSDSLLTLLRVGMAPVVVHGGGPQLNKVLEAAGIEPEYIDGMRVTDKATLETAQKVFQGENEKLTAALRARGISAVPFLEGVVQAKVLDFNKWKFVGKPTGAKVEGVNKVVAAGGIPVISSLAQDEASGATLNVNADTAACELARAVRPLKTVFLNSTGGILHGVTKQRIPVIDVENEYDALLKQPWVKYGTRLKIVEIRDLLFSLSNRASTVTITSTKQLLPALLYGSSTDGTKMKRGYRISHHVTMQALNQSRAASLLSSANPNMGETTARDRIAQLAQTSNIHGVFTDDDCNCLAIVSIPGTGQRPVLEEFAVSSEARVSGSEDQLWDRVRETYADLQWSIPANSTDDAIAWHLQRAKGSLRDDAKNAIRFWYETSGQTETGPAKAAARAHAASGTEPGSGVTSIASTAAAAAAASAAKGERKFSSWAASWSHGVQRRGYATSARKYGIGIVGARGYVGTELMKLIAGHSSFEIACVGSRAHEGQRVSDNVPGLHSDVKYTNITPADIAKYSTVDCWVLALPNGLAGPYVEAIKSVGTSRRTVTVDLSGDHRFDREWQYGLPERFRHDIKDARFISNPGCYASGAQFGLLPLLGSIDGAPSIFGVSGYSGAGTTPSPKNDPKYLADNLIPYSLTGHLHEREVSRQLGRQVHFMPHVAPFFQGITLTISVPLTENIAPQKALEKFQAYYASEPLIRVQKDIPVVKDISRKHHVTIGGFAAAEEGRRLVLVSTIDNLLKGAATQALQNMNLALGVDELEGIKQFVTPK